ncbi:HK97 family phage prohead protease [Streptomyces erythrochromogenes]|uniref:HK97 family phage prohead protease n=1 Tax=Streptomyces erythrochromogenes TaxID=285574 RepID=A0ABZ1QEN2_9ACTN|nr:HK97 family phage prohead protease [Streptomyces erythrochromogenes]
MRTLTRTTTEERRRLPLSTAGLSIRAGGEGGAERFHGYAAVFNSRTSIGNPLRWGFYEEVADGAFTKTVAEGDARMLIDHDSYFVVSRVSAGTLGLAQDARGLAVDSALDAELSYVSDLKANVRNGNITGMSFGFQVVKDDWQLIDVETTDGDTVQAELRILREVRLFEVSAVTFPAYTDTEASLRNVAAALAHRGDQDAIEKRAQYRPELLDLLKYREPGESTRGTEPPAEPAAATRRDRDSVDRRMRALAARYGLPAN